MVGGAAGSAATIGGHAFAKAVCTSPGDAQANAAFSKLPNGVNLSLCDGSFNGTVNPNTVIGKGVPNVPNLPIIKIHA